jgi:hypothetical protein
MSLANNKTIPELESLKTIAKPYLIQRGSFKNTPDTDIIGIDSLISFDYMGSAEFEFGALGQSLKRIMSSWSQYTVIPTLYKDTDNQTMFLLCHKSQAQEIQLILPFITESKHPPFRTKEFIGLNDYITAESEYALRINFWWDITKTDYTPVGNDYMICFGENIKRLILAINKSCIKNNISIEGPSCPENYHFSPIHKPEISINQDSKTIKITKSNGQTSKETIIIKRNIISYAVADNFIIIKVLTKTGVEKDITINEKHSSIRQSLVNILKDWPDINKSQTLQNYYVQKDKLNELSQMK